MAKSRNRRERAPKFSRMERVGELCREIIADELERIADDRLPLVTVTHVEIDPDLRHGRVFYSSLGIDEELVREVLDEHRVELQSAIARQARLKRTPELSFRLDPVIVTSARIEELLREESKGEQPENAGTQLDQPDP